MQASGDDGCIIAEEAVTRAKVGGQIAKMPMLDGVRLSMDDEQPRIIAPIDRLLGD